MFIKGGSRALQGVWRDSLGQEEIRGLPCMTVSALAHRTPPHLLWLFLHSNLRISPDDREESPGVSDRLAASSLHATYIMIRPRDFSKVMAISRSVHIDDKDNAFTSRNYPKLNLHLKN
jgi:hypothetical protein